MGGDKFGIVVFTMLALILIYLDNSGRLKKAIAVANGTSTPAATTTATKTGTTATYGQPTYTSAPAGNPGSIWNLATLAESIYPFS